MMRSIGYLALLVGMSGCGGVAINSISTSKILGDPNQGQTVQTGFPPGELCTASDPNFGGYRYKEHIAYCNRNVSEALKDQIAQNYGVPKSDYSKYEFDHYLPLCIGGDDSIANLWPQPLDQAHQKDVLENQLYDAMNAGTILQADAVAQIRAWRPK